MQGHDLVEVRQLIRQIERLRHGRRWTRQLYGDLRLVNWLKPDCWDSDDRSLLEPWVRGLEVLLHLGVWATVTVATLITIGKPAALLAVAGIALLIYIHALVPTGIWGDLPYLLLRFGLRLVAVVLALVAGSGLLVVGWLAAWRSGKQVARCCATVSRHTSAPRGLVMDPYRSSPLALEGDDVVALLAQLARGGSVIALADLLPHERTQLITILGRELESPPVERRSSCESWF